MLPLRRIVALIHNPERAAQRSAAATATLLRIVGERLAGSGFSEEHDARRAVRREPALLAAAATDVPFEAPEPALNEGQNPPPFCRPSGSIAALGVRHLLYGLGRFLFGCGPLGRLPCSLDLL